MAALFRNRATQPPPDPVNALLSYGYTLLHHHASTALVAAGLHPQIGLFHQGRGRHHALASDLQEEFRSAVDALVWHLIRRREASLDDFTDAEDGTGGVWLSAPLRRKFIERFEERWSTKLIPEEGTEPLAYWQILARQAGRIRLLVRGEVARYEPFRLRA
ncbi:MAG: CRISPR-associated endonuclease Cas1 [Thermoanaerobaculia bacterium]|nr:CRISPR-associated endonuclease Cas1 [Thermoanaerobaculia bacterium]